MLNKEVIVFILCLLFIAPAISAMEVTRLEVPASLNFTGEREFTLYWDGGAKNVKWDNGTVKSNEIFTISSYKELNTSIVCVDESNRYNNLSDMFTSMAEVCRRLADGNNMSIATQMSDIQYSLGLNNQKLTTCLSNTTVLAEKATLYDSCILSDKDAQNKLQVCATELSKTKNDKSGNNAPFLWGLGGLILGWAIWGRNKNKAASEYEQEGYNG